MKTRLTLIALAVALSVSLEFIHPFGGGEMPPPQYRLLHRSAWIAPADLVALKSMQPGGLVQERTTQFDGDPTRGKAVFQKRCTGCHALESSREGPPLGNVFGRKAGSVAGFSYSVGLKKSGITWDEASLERWLSDPDMVISDTKMDFRLPKAQERSDIIAYFKHKYVIGDLNDAGEPRYRSASTRDWHR